MSGVAFCWRGTVFASGIRMVVGMYGSNGWCDAAATTPGGTNDEDSDGDDVISAKMTMDSR